MLMAAASSTAVPSSQMVPDPVSPSEHLTVLILACLHDLLALDQAGNGGISKSGNAYGGNGKRGYYQPPNYFSHGNGGDATTGNTGNANGGGVLNEGWFISNGFGASMYSF